MNVIKYQFKHNMNLFNICEVFIFNRKKVVFMDGSMFKLQNNSGEVLLDLARVTWPQLIWFKHSLMLTFQKQQNSFIQIVKNKN